MSLHTRVLGEGEDLVLLHGWGLNGEVWGETVDHLAQRYRLTIVDLPGHGKSRLSHDDLTLDNLIDELLQHTPQQATWLGWSLGGLIALAVLLRKPDIIQRLILVAVNAKFVKSDTWPHGVDGTVLNGFANTLEHDYETTLQRFITLQAKGGENSRDTIKQVRERLSSGGQPQPAALRGGLSILQNSDFIDQLAKVRCPTLLLYGRLDMLVPAGAGKALSEKISNARLHIFPHAAHAPFLSHTDEFVRVVNEFMEHE